MDEQPRPPQRLRSLDFRHVLTTMIWDLGRPVEVRELVELLERNNVDTRGRPSKVVSDALRWEVGKGRVVRTRRGTYAPSRIPRSTRWWLRRRSQEALGSMSAA